jgi:oligopeptide transport system permease protein
MRRIFQRVCFILITLFFVITMTFILMKSIPGDPFTDEKALPKEVHEALAKHYGLDEPYLVQYLKFLRHFVSLDFGESMRYQGLKVSSIIKDHFPVSCYLGMQALFLALGVGTFFGSFSALRNRGPLDRILLFFTTFAFSLPNFCLSVLLQYIFAIKLSWFPVAGWESFLYFVLPTLSLSALPLAFIMKLTKEQVEKNLNASYVKTAFAKGLRKRTIVWKHVLPNSLFPLLGYLGQMTVNILVGSFVIEKIFAIPGLGGYFVKSIFARDYTVIMGLTLFYAVLLISFVALSEITILLLDPRQRTNKHYG